MRELFGALVLADMKVSGGHFLRRGQHHDLVSGSTFSAISVVGLGQNVYLHAC
jgi:hypothetical protein